MEWEAVVVIGTFSFVFGTLLYVPARWWARRKLRESPPDSNARLHVTSAGFALAALLVGLLLFGYAHEHVAPESDLGRFVSTGSGRLVFGAAVSVVAIVVGMVLELLGFKLVHRSDRDA